jgi:hypothetical protein
LLLQRFIDFDVALQYVGQELRQTNSFSSALGAFYSRMASLDRSWQKDLSIRWHVMQAANALAEVDISGHLVVFAGSIIHTCYSQYDESGPVDG